MARARGHFDQQAFSCPRRNRLWSAISQAVKAQSFTRKVEVVIEAIGVPTLMKAVDLLIDYVKDRLAHRPKQTPGSMDLDVTTVRGAIGALNVDEALLARYREELSAILTQLEIHQRNLAKLRSQKAEWTEALVPPIIENSIRDESNAIDQKTARLRHIVEALTGRQVPEGLAAHLAHLNPL